MKIALYLRVSIDKQETENQAIVLREFAAKQGWEIVHEYCDYESGAKAGRVAFKQMFADAAQHKFDLVMFWALDRLSREGVLETLQYLRRLESYGVGYKSFTEQFFDSCGVFKDAILAIMATLAKQERVKRSERTKAGLARVRASGKRLGRRAVAVEPARVHELRAAGKSFRDVAATLGISAGTAHKLAKF
jgi:DNA invertase Pin-like site-specific DNA recombinase